MAAKYDLRDPVEKRVRFFDGQFLQDQDFIDEQHYHLDRQRRHNRLLHVGGIAEGLAVAVGEANTVTVTPGTAIDSDGRQIVLAQTATVDLPAEKFNDKAGIRLYVAYHESAEEQQTEAGSADYTRWSERPQLLPLAPGEAYRGATPPMLLAQLALDNQGSVTVDLSVREYSGLRLPGPAADAPTLRAAPSGRVGLAGSLTVSAAAEHVQLRREATETGGGKRLFLELYQDDPNRAVPEVQPCIRFHHNNRYWHRIEAQGSGFHFKDGHLPRDSYVNVTAASVVASGGKFRLDGAQQVLFSDADTSNNLKLQLWTGYGLGINPGTLFYAANGRHSWRDDRGANERMALTTGADGGLRVSGTGTSSFAGSVGIGTTDPKLKLTVSAATEHVQLRREAKETTGGKQLFLELYQDDSSPAKVDEVQPCIRFHHNNRYWHRIEAQGSGFHFKDGHLPRDSYVNVTAASVVASGGKFRLDGAQQVLFSDADTSSNLKLQLWTGYGLGINPGTLFYAANGRHSWRDDRGANERMALTTGADGGLRVSGTGTSSFAGSVGIGTTDPKLKLTVSAATEHVQLRREAKETTGGKQLFLELYQDDSSPAKVDEVHPCIRFHHGNRYWHRLEAQSGGFHFKDGHLPMDSYVNVTAASVVASGGKFRLDGAQQVLFSDADTSNNLKVQLWTGYGLGINPGTLFYAANGRHSWRDDRGANERMLLTTGADGGLTVSGTGKSSFAGSVDIGSIKTGARLTVFASTDHLQLRRGDMDKAGGKRLFLELYQDDSSPAKVAEVFPCLRFHHGNRYWHRIEAQGSGFYFKTGALESDALVDLYTNRVVLSELRMGTMMIGPEEVRALRRLTPRDTLRVGEQLNPGEFLTSANGRYTLVMQNDGNLVEYEPGGRPLWATNINIPGTVLINRTDGTIVLIAPGDRQIWSTKTSVPGTVLVIQDDHNIVAYGPNRQWLWDTVNVK